MMDFILDIMPWWGWLVIAAPAGFLSLRYLGVNATVILGIAAVALAIFAKGRKAGVEVERERQHQAEDGAREIIHETREDVRSIPSTPDGEVERKSRFNRWSK